MPHDARHPFQDSFKLSTDLKYSFWTYLLDQVTHIALIACIVFLSGIKNLPPPKESSNLLITIYNSDTVIIYLIAMIFATYNGYFLIRCFKASFLGDPGKYNIFEKWYGMLERLLIVTAFFYGRFLLFLIPFILLARPLVSLLDKGERFINKEFVSFQEMALNWIISVVTGVILSLCI